MGVLLKPMGSIRAYDEAREQAVYSAQLNLAIAARMVVRVESKKRRRYALWYLARCVEDLDKAAGTEVP